ncbi:hypothetical protein [Bacillus phage phiAGATE]|uniref:Repressor Rok winged helix domain-containing protein n=1 Tax=Bacillus phage phiAGATE TaxID=1204533 RepID=L0LBQ9_9CAUD|nr:hypothetical protein G380_gp149 [Bacillus phage phiAGATE]AGB62595.1 hypothetical protein [Bacillus phage phiAGATE]
MEKMYTEREANRMYAEYLKQQVVYRQYRIEMVQEELKGVVEKIEKLDSISTPLIDENKIENNTGTENDSITAAVVRAYNQNNSFNVTDDNEREDDIPLPFATTSPRKSANKGKRRGKYKTSRSGSDRRDVKKVAKLVVHILKEAKEPISLNKLKEELEKRNIPTHSMYALLQQVREYESRVTKASWGYYRYKGE